MSCPYCTPDERNGFTTEIADSTYKTAAIEDGQLWVQLRYELDTDWVGHPSGEIDAYFDIKHCPMCGRRLDAAEEG